MTVGTVVVFGTLSMFLYPILYRVGWLPMPPEIFGVYIGATVHEVAHVVGAGDAVSTARAQTAVVVKMTRVMLLAPALVGIGWWWKRGRDDGSHEAASAGVPWFALGFIAVVGFNSLRLLPQDVVSQIISLDSFLLTMAMTALGLSTVVRELRGLGWVPLQLGLALFVWLVAGGYGLTRLLMG